MTRSDSLRPPAEVQTLRTNGRKSSKARKKKAGEDGEELVEGEEPVEGLDPDADVTAGLAEEGKLSEAAAAAVENGPVDDKLKEEVLETVGTGPLDAQGETLVEPKTKGKKGRSAAAKSRAKAAQREKKPKKGEPVEEAQAEVAQAPVGDAIDPQSVGMESPSVDVQTSTS